MRGHFAIMLLYHFFSKLCFGYDFESIFIEKGSDGLNLIQIENLGFSTVLGLMPLLLDFFLFLPRFGWGRGSRVGVYEGRIFFVSLHTFVCALLDDFADLRGEERFWHIQVKGGIHLPVRVMQQDRDGGSLTGQRV